MSEIEDPFILLEPSCDIHLVLIRGMLLEEQHHLPLRVFRGVWDPVARRHDLTVLRDDVEIDWFGLGGVNVDPASIVTIDPADAEGRRRLTPRARGQVLVQVRYMDPARLDTYEYLLARIWVHDSIDGWWFGHQRIDLTDDNSLPGVSVFRDMELAHTQPTVLALFDETAPGGGVVGDISGHDYVRLTSADPAICAVDTTYSGRLRGASLGETQITGRLDVLQPDVPAEQLLVVRVVDPHLPPHNTLSQVRVDEEADPRSKLNLLFLGEGFTALGSPPTDPPDDDQEEDEEHEPEEDRDRFEEAVLELTERLFDDRRHEPFHLLRDQFNVWSHYAPSRHRGLTPGPQLTLHGTATNDDPDLRIRYIPEQVRPDDKKKPGYSLQDLLLLVGLPGQDEPGSVGGDVAARVAQLRALWSQPGSLPAFLGYDDALATPKIVEAWTHLRSRGIALAVDTLYGLMQGSRWGDRKSGSDRRADMISQPAATASEETRVAFARRVHRWFDPERAVRSVGLDPRRYALEYHAAGWRLFLRYVSRLVDRRDPPGSDDRLGRVWDPDAELESSSGERRRSSAGLLCVLVNSSRQGGTATYWHAVRVTLGRQTHFPRVRGRTSGRIRRLSHGANADYEVDHRARANTLAHEIGHSFYGLGDEYEEERGAASVSIEERDNLTHADTVREEGTIESEDLPTPIDPERIKWALLHRIAKADVAVRPTEIGGSAGPGRSNRIIVTLAPGRAERWRKELEEDSLVYLRRLKSGDAARRRQLPIADRDLYEELTIESIPDDHTVHLFGDAPLATETFPAGSVLYLPMLDESNGMPRTLVHERVLEFMQTSGLPLTENHFAPGDDDPDDGKFSDPVSKEKDVPPGISGFARPCQEHKLLGLYEGGATVTRMVYRPSGGCKMRASQDKKEGEFCFVCKYLQVNLVDASRHPELDKLYPRPSWLKKFLRGDG